MKSLFILLLFIPAFLFAEIIEGHQVRPDGKGGYSIQEPTGKEYARKAAYESKPEYKQQSKWFNSNFGNASVQNSVGAKTASSLPSVVVHSVDKKSIMRALFQRAKTGGIFLATKGNTVGWVITGYMLVDPDLRLFGWVFDADKGTYVRPVGSYLYVYSCQSSVTTSKPNSGNYAAYETWYKSVPSCTFQKSYDLSQDLGEPHLTHYCKSVTPDPGQHQVGYQGGRCTLSGYPQPIYFVTFALLDTVPMTQEDFDQIILPKAEPEPTAYVRASADSQYANPSSLSYVAEFSKPLQSMSLTTAPYTNPLTGKAQESKFDVTVNGDKWSVKETLTPRPDLNGNEELAPTPDIPAQPQPETKPESSASAPVQCDKYPDTLGCEKMGDGSEAESIFSDIKIPEITNPAEFKLDNFLPDNGSCPAPKTYSTSHGSIIYSYEKHCDVARTLRPFLIAFASVTALYLIFFRKA